MKNSVAVGFLAVLEAAGVVCQHIDSACCMKEERASSRMQGMGPRLAEAVPCLEARDFRASAIPQKSSIS